MAAKELATSREEDLQRLRAVVETARRDKQPRLPPEAKLAEQIGVTRARLRVLLKRLETEGLIWRHVGKGTFVGERSMTNALGTLAEQLNPAEAFEARMVIEPELSALAALRATPRQIDEMKACLVQMEALTSFVDWAVWDERLHRLVAKAADNKLLLTMYDTVRESTPSGMQHRLHSVFKSPRKTTNAEHRAYVEAIASRDPERAAGMMRSHLESVRTLLFGSHRR